MEVRIDVRIKGLRMKLSPVVLALPLFASFLCALAPARAQQAPSTHGWQQSDKTDPNRAISTIQFTLFGRFTDPPRGSVPGPPSIVLVCEPSDHKRAGTGKYINGYVQVGSPLKVDYVEPSEIHGTSYYPEVPVNFRVDNEKPQDTKWPPRSDKTSIALDKDAAKKLLHGREVVISTTEPFESQIVMHFDVPDSTAVFTTCGIREHR
jgi:hypothetical protein